MFILEISAFSSWGSDNNNHNDNNVNIDDNTSSLRRIKYLLTESRVWVLL